MGFSFFKSSGTGYLRSTQVAEYMGAKLNPKSGFENDVCIYVKSHPRADAPERSYFDICDSKSAYGYLKQNPQMGVIVYSKTAYEFAAWELKKKVHLIPHHHCNFDRVQREPGRVRRVGVIGNEFALSCDEDALRKTFESMGLEFIHEYYYKERGDVVYFYLNLDIQIVWRPQMRPRLCNPLKLSNAGSFGIPTVAFPEKAYSAEWDGCFVPVFSVEDMVKAVKHLIDEPSYYNEIANRALERAEQYHIENVVELYYALEEK